jgi:hypothetical protein
MIRLFINGLAASAGGGLTYLRNVIPHLARRADAQTTVLLNSAMRREFGELPDISFEENSETFGAFRRFVHEQTVLPKLIRRSGAQVLIGTLLSPRYSCLVTRFTLPAISSATFVLAETTRYGRTL